MPQINHSATESQLLLLLLSHFSRVRLCDPRDGSQPGSPVPGIFQARIQWVPISFSREYWKQKVKVKSLSRVRLLATPWTAAYQAPPSMGFSRQEYWSGVPLPSLMSHSYQSIKCKHYPLVLTMSCSLVRNLSQTSKLYHSLYHKN